MTKNGTTYDYHINSHGVVKNETMGSNVKIHIILTAVSTYTRCYSAFVTANRALTWVKISNYSQFIL